MIEIGQQAPEITLPNQNGQTVTATKQAGYVVVYFYPQDDTPGCTKQACSLRDGYEKLQQKGIEVYGISADDQQSHTEFTKKYNLPFTLLIDEKHKVASTYHAYGEKNLYGKIVIGVKRTTFIIKDGIVVDIIKRPKVDDHANQILNRINKL